MAIVESGADTVKATGTVGDSVRIKISLASGQDALFGFKVATLSYSTLDLVATGCTAYSTIVTQPGLSAAGVLYVSFTLFRPVSSETVAASSLSLTVALDVCSGACTAYTCAKRRRRSDDESGLVSGNSTLQTVTAFTSILVYPPGQEPQADTQISADVCIARAPMLGLLLGLCTALVICLCVSTWLFCKLRKSGERLNSKMAFANSGYKA